MTNSSSPTHGVALMAKGEIPELTDFFKGTTVSEEELQAYHSHGWLTGNVLSSIPEVEVPTVIGLTVLCFESHLLAGLGLSPSKFLAAIMNYLDCSLVHFNVNAIAALSCFVMLCEYRLGILLDFSLFWIRQICLWQDQIIFAPPSSRRVHSSALQGLLEALSEEMVSGGHACSTFVGEQTLIPPYQNLAS
jgi:hypothetical protein